MASPAQIWAQNGLTNREPGGNDLGSDGSDVYVDHVVDENDENQSIEAYGKLIFGDGDYYIKECTTVILGRDMSYYQLYVDRERAQASAGEGTPVHVQSENCFRRFHPAGGVVALPPSDAEQELVVRRNRSHRVPSQSDSIDPADLHVSLVGDQDRDDRSTFLPVHPPDDCGHLIKAISRKHVKIKYHPSYGNWKLHVVGSYAIVNGRYKNRNAIVDLEGETDVEFSGVRLTIILASHCAGESGESGDDVDVHAESDEDAAAAVAVADDENETSSPDSDAVRKRHKRPSKKVKKSRALEVQTSEKLQDVEDGEDDWPMQDVAAAQERPDRAESQLGGDSVLLGIPLEELPQRPRGPGRPPKNGFISKRDHQFMKREVERRRAAGLEELSMAELVKMARSLNKKEKPSNTASPNAAGADKGPGRDETPLDAGTEPTSGVDGKERASSPRYRRNARSVSPIKPEHEFTAAEMERPSQTYLVLLDELLREIPGGRADLQEIYDRFQKKYPWYRYRAESTGWQSSIRHNLKTHERFIECGRSGKGKLWTVDTSKPLETEKSRKSNATQRRSVNAIPARPQYHEQPQQQAPASAQNGGMASGLVVDNPLVQDILQYRKHHLSHYPPDQQTAAATHFSQVMRMCEVAHKESKMPGPAKDGVEASMIASLMQILDRYHNTNVGANNFPQHEPAKTQPPPPPPQQQQQQQQQQPPHHHHQFAQDSSFVPVNHHSANNYNGGSSFGYPPSPPQNNGFRSGHKRAADESEEGGNAVHEDNEMRPRKRFTGLDTYA
ncbi:hypothetical protein K470DRAFT_230646 [Piedraia hortae CBS 480.64]|uniref:Fork-head domain-containing protein n=1 Tax=Piedraia hortae CBS 480.64 TaxID=1314780 RepID=A0A6A7C1W1_9PEZI|nr:hypothetical protein K470DRAFT_230646 [Piedraia hortae CBS 480.64]